MITSFDGGQLNYGQDALADITLGIQMDYCILAY